MSPLEQKPGPGWWKETEGYRTYHMREFSGVLIALWLLFFLNIPYHLFGVTITNPFYINGMHIIGLIGAVIHTSTWLKIMPQITPFDLNKSAQNIAFAVLILIWLVVSGAMLHFVWT